MVNFWGIMKKACPESAAGGRRIYLDNAATTGVDPQVFEVMKPYLKDMFGNPFSLHSWGVQSKEAIEKAREQVAKALNCKSEEIIFTSGATEANNLAIKGVVEAVCGGDWDKAHIVISPTEHHCITGSAKHLEKLGVEVTWLSVDKYGLVDPKDVAATIKGNTILVSVMYVNNEVGTIEPIQEIGKIIKTRQPDNPPASPSDSRGGRGQTTRQPIFHTDAVQAIQYLDCDVQKLGVDFLSLSAHKFYGPKGVGALYIRDGTPLVRQMDGGGQEQGRRAGTHNVVGIVGLGEAMELIGRRQQAAGRRVRELRDKLIEGVVEIPGIQLTGHPEKRAPHIASFVIDNVEGEAMVLLLNEEGIAASSGSACTSGELEPSDVLTAMRIPPELSHGSLRLSLSKYTTEEEVDYVLEVLLKVVEKLRYNWRPKGSQLQKQYVSLCFHIELKITAAFSCDNPRLLSSKRRRQELNNAF